MGRDRRYDQLMPRPELPASQQTPDWIAATRSKESVLQRIRSLLLTISIIYVYFGGMMGLVGFNFIVSPNHSYGLAMFCAVVVAIHGYVLWRMWRSPRPPFWLVLAPLVIQIGFRLVGKPPTLNTAIWYSSVTITVILLWRSWRRLEQIEIQKPPVDPKVS